ncbi:MAG: 6-bladed beta-propeller, partial [Candidatus Eisenbacteria bacterium]|nr:6-bladed beta-propeller [Candidatus Eisenbacteria bacterium]
MPESRQTYAMHANEAARTIIGLLLVLALSSIIPAWAGEVMKDAGVVHVRNESTPRDGLETLPLEEQWRTGADENDPLMGVIWQILQDDQGRLYLLDRQLNQVHIFSAQGDHLGTLGREGEGPGEFRHATDMILLPDRRLGVVQAMPGKIVLLDFDGSPAGTIVPGAGSAHEGFNLLQEALRCGEHLAVVGRQMQRTESGFQRLQYLARLDMDGREIVRLITKRNPDRLAEGVYVERDEYFVGRGRWTMDPDGRIYAAESRDEYAISVYSPDGELERVIQREFTPRRRSPEEKARVGEGMVVVVNGERVQMEVEAEDHPPCISAMHVTDDGELWVL